MFTLFDIDLRYSFKQLGGFRMGVVELEFSLVAYKGKGDNYIIKLMLYSLVLLDDSLANVSI